MIPFPAALGFAGVSGLALGSFAVTCGLRMARGETALAGRSRCDICGRALGFAQTVPLAAYVGLRGACSGCGGRIDPAHPAGELAGAAVLICALLTGDLMRGALLAALGLVLIAAAAVDLRALRLPNVLTLSAGALTLPLAISKGGGAAALEGAVAGTITIALLLSLRWIGERLRGEPGLGLGDVKMTGALAIWLGAETAWTVALAAMFGLAAVLLWRPAADRLPFGPALVAAAWIVGVGKELGLWPTMM